MTHDLIPRIRAGDRQAFETVAAEYYARLVRHAYRYVRDLSSAEDIVQDTLLRLWMGREQLVVQNSIVSYLFGAVRNRALNYTRNQHVVARRELWLSDDDVIAAEPAAPDIGAEDDDAGFERTVTIVRDAVAALPARQGEAFALRVEHGMSFAEIAEVMGLSLRSAQTTYLRAVQLLRRRLTPFFPS